MTIKELIFLLRQEPEQARVYIVGRGELHDTDSIGLTEDWVDQKLVGVMLWQAPQ